MQIVLEELTVKDIDEALEHLRLSLQDYYGHRLTYQQREFYLSSVDDLLDARIILAGGQNGNKISGDSQSDSRSTECAQAHEKES